MNNQNQFDIQSKEFLKKITDLEFENSVLSQKNKFSKKNWNHSQLDITILKKNYST